MRFLKWLLKHINISFSNEDTYSEHWHDWQDILDKSNDAPSHFFESFDWDASGIHDNSDFDGSDGSDDSDGGDDGGSDSFD